MKRETDSEGEERHLSVVLKTLFVAQSSCLRLVKRETEDPKPETPAFVESYPSQSSLLSPELYLSTQHFPILALRARRKCYGLTICQL